MEDVLKLIPIHNGNVVHDSRVAQYVTGFTIFFIFISMISHILDVGSDAYLAYRYHYNEQTTYLQFTLIFIIFPAIVHIVFSSWMYFLYDATSVSRTAAIRWIIRAFILILQLDPIVRYCRYLWYAFKSYRAEKEGDYSNLMKFYGLMLAQDRDMTFLRMFECFLEAAPQQVLQITILLRSDPQAWTFQYYSQLGSICTSLFSMGVYMVSFRRTQRFFKHRKDDIRIAGKIVQFLWHFMVTLSRILSISVAAALFPLPTMAACAIHLLLMATWQTVTTEPICRCRQDWRFVQRVGDFVLFWIPGMVHIFTYLPREGSNTRFKYICYYLLFAVENITAAVVWGTTAGPVLRLKWYFYPLLVGCIVPFGLGIGFMVLYYLCFHPSSTQESVVAPTSEDVPYRFPIRFEFDLGDLELDD